MTSPIEEIKNRLDIVDVIQGYIRLQKAGRNYRALCPFHSEKTPSFMVSPERQLWKCFGCGKGGSIFDFVMEIEGVEFGDALRMLAQRAGVELKNTDRQLSAKLKTERTRLFEICDLANRFFVKQLEASQAGKNIQKYLTERGLKPQTIKDWQIGYAPNQWQALSDFLKNRGYPESEIVKSGLAIKNERKKTQGLDVYDRFRDRIIFPIKNLSGLVIGFSGRENPNNPESQMGKYINTPNTLIYDKSSILYGLDKAKLALRKENLCILVEGQMDVIMSHQAGFSNTVATSGTALTEQQLKIIKRYTENLAIAFDTDLAGEEATKRGIDLSLQFDLNTKVISLPNGQDPADLIRTDVSAWSQAVNWSRELVDFYLSSALAKNSPETAKGKKEISRIVLPVIKKIPNKVEQAYWIQELARRLKVQETALIEEMGKIKNTRAALYGAAPKNTEDRADKSPRITNLEEYTIGLILAHPKMFKKCQNEHCALFTNSDLSKIFDAFKKSKGNMKKFKKILPSPLIKRIDSLVFEVEAQKSLVDQFEPEKEIEFCFNQLKKNQIKTKFNQLNLAIQEAESKNDKPALKRLTEEFDKLTKQIAL